METSQPISIESFSYSWLVNLKPSLDSLENNSLRASLDASDESSSFIEMDPRMPPSKRFFRNSNSYDFKFDLPISQSSSIAVLHADELFSNGYVVPLFVNPLKIEANEALEFSPTLPISSNIPRTVILAGKSPSSLRKCRNLSKRIIQKYLHFLTPLYRKIRGRRPSSRDESVDTRFRVLKDWSPDTSPKISVADDDWRKSCDSESSIYEAVLYCKRSIGD